MLSNLAAALFALVMMTPTASVQMTASGSRGSRRSRDDPG
jgi:hypothetical protein